MTNRKPLWQLLPSVGLIACALLLAACTTRLLSSSDSVVTREFDFADFDKVEVSDAFVVQIRQGDEYRVTIEIDQKSLRDLEVKQNGKTLEIGFRPRSLNFFEFINLSDPVHRAEITMPSLVSVAARDATHIEVHGFNTDGEALFKASDASSIRGEIHTGEARIKASNGSHIDLEGNRGDVEVEAEDVSAITLVGEGRNATIHADNASNIHMDRFTVQDADVRASDASHVWLNATGRLDADARDASGIIYGGNPTLGKVSSRDASSINPLN